MTTKKIRYLIEALFTWTFFHLFSILPINISSSLGSFLARRIGPLLKVNKLAINNIKNAMPEKTDKEISNIIDGMWDNLGRTLAEFSHIHALSKEQYNKLTDIHGIDFLQQSLKHKGGIFFTAHFGNWEIAAKTGYIYNLPLSIVYRKANNPYVDKIIYNARKGYNLTPIAKGASGARQIINTIKKGEMIAMLVDQKQNDGIEVPFFNMPAMTAPAIASLALKFNCPVYPTKITRKKGEKFRVDIYPNINTDPNISAYDFMVKINNMIEGWIRENPEQWFWVHKRWAPKPNR